MTHDQDDLPQDHLSWVKVRIITPSNRVEEAAAVLWEEGASGVEIQDHMMILGSADEKPADGFSRAVTYFGGESVEDVRARLSRAIADANLEEDATLEVTIFEDETWKEKWKQFFKPLHLSARLGVRPPWEEADFGPGVKTVIIEPGMAFGTGQHATTKLCLAWLDELCGPPEPSAILDVGCGSGILGIGAALLTQGTRIEGVDIDPEALRVCRENFEMNGVVGRVQVRIGLVSQVEGRFPVVVANILANVLRRLRDDILAKAEPGGLVLLSGLALVDEEPVRAYYQAAGCVAVDRRDLDGWVALLLRAPA